MSIAIKSYQMEKQLAVQRDIFKAQKNVTRELKVNRCEMNKKIDGQSSTWATIDYRCGSFDHHNVLKKCEVQLSALKLNW